MKEGVCVLVAVVGVCVSGKSILVKGLREAGYDAYNVAQEHSCVKSFWNRRRPDALILLDVSLAAAKKRRAVSWDESRLAVQRERLADARAHADLCVFTDPLSQEEVLQQVIRFIRGKEDGTAHVARPAAGP